MSEIYDFLDKNRKPSGYYDRVYSLGTDCRPKQAMRYNFIGCKRSPFDWLGNYELKNTIRVLENDFKDFFLYENLRVLPEEDNPYHTIVLDEISQMTSQHDFPKENFDLEKLYPAFKAKLDGIVAAFKADLKKPQKVLFILHFEMAWIQMCLYEGAHGFIYIKPKLFKLLEDLCGHNHFDVQLITFREELLEIADDRLFVNIKPMEPFHTDPAKWMQDNERIFWTDLLKDVKLNDPSLRKGYAPDNYRVILESEKHFEEVFSIEKVLHPDRNFGSLEHYKSELKKEGAVVLPSLMSDEFLNKLLQDIQMNHRKSENETQQFVEQVQHIWYRGQGPRALIKNEEFKSMIAELLGVDSLRMWYDQSFCKKAQVVQDSKFEQNASLWPFLSPYIQYSVLIALEDISIESNVLQFIPHSHHFRNQLELFQNFDESKGSIQIENKTLKPVSLALKKGDVFIYNSDLWTRSLGNHSDGDAINYVLHLFENGTCFDKNGPFAQYHYYGHGDIIESLGAPLLGSEFQEVVF